MQPSLIRSGSFGRWCTFDFAEDEKSRLADDEAADVVEEDETLLDDARSASFTNVLRAAIALCVYDGSFSRPLAAILKDLLVAKVACMARARARMCRTTLPTSGSGRGGGREKSSERAAPAGTRRGRKEDGTKKSREKKQKRVWSRGVRGRVRSWQACIIYSPPQLPPCQLLQSAQNMSLNTWRRMTPMRLPSFQSGLCWR